jgi:hypothetical protein
MIDYSGVLVKPITGGLNRHLTEQECRKLRLLGLSCSVRWVVLPIASGYDYMGYLYYPDGHGYSNAGCRVT